ncbi:MAG: hypothetical protein GX096_04045 [Clostridiales bacterium]|nr:hypothetical protein [Clostridiales bacterium]
MSMEKQTGNDTPKRACNCNPKDAYSPDQGYSCDCKNYGVHNKTQENAVLAAQKKKRHDHDDHSGKLCDMAHMADEPMSTDVLGSYTGTAADGDVPEQDADDL